MLIDIYPKVWCWPEIELIWTFNHKLSNNRKMRSIISILAVLALLHTALSQFSYIPGRALNSCTSLSTQTKSKLPTPPPQTPIWPPPTTGIPIISLSTTSTTTSTTMQSPLRATPTPAVRLRWLLSWLWSAARALSSLSLWGYTEPARYGSSTLP